ncbi:MAG TPA: hypothetical protein VFS88_03405 [Micavibrio sp.]|nr:hypothetical protein [Micavibrio sp.]
MKTNDFNLEARTPRYGYAPSPVHPRAFQILKYDDSGHEGPLFVGDYTVLDSRENLQLSEKKVMNLISLLNCRKNLMQLGHETGTRVLYHIVSECDDDGKRRVLFYQLGKDGISVENALFRMEADNAI